MKTRKSPRKAGIEPRNSRPQTLEHGDCQSWYAGNRHPWNEKRVKIRGRLDNYAFIKKLSNGKMRYALRLLPYCFDSDAPRMMYFLSDPLLVGWRYGDEVEFNADVMRWEWNGKSYSALTRIDNLRNLTLRENRPDTLFDGLMREHRRLVTRVGESAQAREKEMDRYANWLRFHGINRAEDELVFRPAPASSVNTGCETEQ